MTGRTLAHYRVVEKLGSGGMGEVWRATDTRLGRDVAIKILPAAFARDPERLARFQREAVLLASLNHPNIAAIYGLEETDGVHFLVLELVPGEALSGPQPVEEAIRLARQITEAMSEAHQKGIIHRDLKPANIKVTPDGKVKVLDFGLAKAFSAEPVSESLSQSPTLTAGATREGVILGTAAYMSPEQARGKSLDRRTDIWAFGCVLYELLTGRRVFGGDSTPESLAAILRGEPDWDLLPPDTPPALRRLLRRCLRKEPAERLHDIADARLELDEALEAPPAPPPAAPRQRSWTVPAALFLLGVALGAALWWRLGRTPPPPEWSGVLLGGSAVAYGPRLSPDGKLLAFHAMAEGLNQVAVMKPESGNWTVLTRDRSRGFIADLSWSHDGTKIYFDRFLGAPRGVYTVPVLGGAERLVLEDAMAPQELPDGSLLVTRVNAERNYQLHRYWPEASRLEPLPVAVVYSGWWTPAQVFPDGKEAVVYGRPLSSQENRLYAVELASGRLRELALATLPPNTIPSLAVHPDGRSVVLTVRSGKLSRILSVPRQGSAPVTPLLSLTLAVSYLDIGHDGSLYVDQIDRSGEALRLPASGGQPERQALPTTEGVAAALPLPDGRVLAPSQVAGRSRLMVAAWGQDPTPLLDTPEETSFPVTLLGDRDLAFLAGSGAGRRIAVASLAEGRIVRRLPAVDLAGTTSLAASRDAQTLYYSVAGSVWSIPAAGGEPRKIHSGDSVAVDPRNGDLVISLPEKDGVRLVRLPASGGPEQPVPITGDLRLAPTPLASNAIGKDGRILAQFTAPHTWFFPAGLLDPLTGRLQPVPVPYQGDMFAPGWDREGRVVTLAYPLRSTLWRFRRQ